MRDDRFKKALGDGRESRASEDLSRDAPENQSALSDERRKMWKDEWTQSALPTVPELKGWHLCWLSATSSYDSIDKRIRLGYQPVKAEEIPGFENHRVKAGEHTGFIACNEMLLFKIPMDVYQDIMTHFHHDMPLEEADKVQRTMENNMNMRDRSGRSLATIEGEGMDDLQKAAPAPVFR